MGIFKEKIYQYKELVALFIWGALILSIGLLRFDAYGIDESAARALLLNWTVADRVVNPIVTLGAPDLRALLFFPLGAYWTGSFIALKVFTALMLFGAAIFFYRWSKQEHGDEAALIATGLFVIAPLSFMQINAVGIGPFLLVGFGAGLWLNHAYRDRGKQLGGYYFSQMLLVATIVSIHPAGLAYPLALAWEWRNHPGDENHKKQMQIGVAIAAVFALVFRFGWPTLEWGSNPFISLNSLLMGHIPGDPAPIYATSGILPFLIVMVVFFFNRKTIMESLIPRMLTLALLLGLVAADYGWALIALCFVLYLGTPLLIRANNALGATSFVGQRGLVITLLFVITTMFMLGDRMQRSSVISATVAPHDDIIRALAMETEHLEENFHTASQWPGRTMLALKRPVFPLPPNVDSADELHKILGKVSFIIFDPHDPENKQLRDNIANSSGTMETLINQPNGVIVKIKRPAD